MGPMRVLVTGFGPFPGVTLNPSEAAVDALQRRADTGRMPGLQVGTAVLPVDFTTIPGQIAEIMRLVRPQLVLCTGVDMGAEAITVERVAINLLDARVPDIKGAQPVDQPVVPGAPDGWYGRGCVAARDGAWVTPIAVRGCSPWIEWLPKLVSTSTSSIPLATWPSSSSDGPNDQVFHTPSSSSSWPVVCVSS